MGNGVYLFDNYFTIVLTYVRQYSIYVHDYGAPVGFRLAATHPERIQAIITQNGNAYEEGLLPSWDPIRAYWEHPTDENKERLRSLLTADFTKYQYIDGNS